MRTRGELSTPRVILGAMWLALFATPSAVDAQLLDRASDAVRGTPSQESSSSDNTNSSSQSSSSYDSSDSSSYATSESPSYTSDYSAYEAPTPTRTTEWLQPAIAPDAGYPPMPTYAETETPTERPARWVFLPYPYAEGAEGDLVLTEPGSTEVGRSVLRLHLEGGYVLAGAGRMSAGMHAQLSIPLDFTLEYSAFLEPVPDGIAALALGRLGMSVRLVTLPMLQLRIGGAARHFHDALGPLFGGDGEIAIDVFPIAPLVLSASITVGAVGEAVLVDARSTVGILFEGFEIYLGYRLVGLYAGQWIDLGGPTLGLRGWL